METLNGSLERIYRAHRQQLFTCALSITRCPERAEDAIQNAFYRLFCMDKAPDDLKAYVFRAVRNAAVDLLRKNTPSADEIDEFIFDPRDDPHETANKKEFKHRVMQALLCLSDDERETIVQHIYANLTFREIAELRRAPIGTVAAWHHRGLKKLRDLLEE